MPYASHRLDLYLVLGRPDDPASAIDPAWEAGLAEGWWTALGDPGERARALVPGGFVRAVVEQFGSPRLITNQQGGFRVRCPGCGVLLTTAFSRAVTAWRGGGPRQVLCACGVVSPLEAVRSEPPLAIAASWIWLVDVQSAALGEDAPGILSLVGHKLTVVGRRVA